MDCFDISEKKIAYTMVCPLVGCNDVIQMSYCQYKSGYQPKKDNLSSSVRRPNWSYKSFIQHFENNHFDAMTKAKTGAEAQMGAKVED